MTEADTGVIWPCAKKCQQPPEAGRGKKQIHPENTQRKCSCANTFIQA